MATTALLIEASPLKLKQGNLIIAFPVAHLIGLVFAEVIPKFTRAAALQCFDTLVVRERAGCDQETIVHVGKIKTQSIASQRSTDDPHNDYVVVTILLAAEGKHSKSLTFTDSSDVKRVLEELASIDPRKRVLGVEVLWTPQLSSNAASRCIN
ncbi:hypothetical protein ACLB2K_038126 [Fragaria x ananassa]